MRFGLIFMYPDMNTVNTAGGNTPITTLTGPKKPEGENQQVDNNVKLSESVFSSLDSNKNNAVNYSESSSIFANARKSLAGSAAETTLNEAAKDSGIKDKIMNAVFTKFNADSSFQSIVSKFEHKFSTATTATGTDTKSLKANADQLRSGLDAEVKNAAQSFIDNANTLLAQQYKDAMDSVIADYKNGKYENANFDDKDPKIMQNSLAAKYGSGNESGTVGEIQDKENNGEVKFETTAFSKFDTVADGKITAKDNEVSLKSLNDIVGSKLTRLGSDTNLAKAIQQDLTAAYNSAKEAYSLDVGSKDISAKTEADLVKKQNEAIAKLDQKVQSKKASADKNLEKEMTKAFDTAFKANLANPEQIAIKANTINAKSGDDTISIVPNGDGFTATFNGQPAKFVPNTDATGGGVVTTNDGKTSVTVDKSGNVKSRTETETTTIKTKNEGETGTKTTSTTTSDDGESNTYIRTEISSNGVVNRSADFANGDLSSFTFTPAGSEGDQSTKPVRVTIGTDGTMAVVGEGGDEIEGAKATPNGDGKYSVEVGGKTYTVSVDKASGDITADEVKAAPENASTGTINQSGVKTAHGTRYTFTGTVSFEQAAKELDVSEAALRDANPRANEEEGFKPGNNIYVPDSAVKSKIAQNNSPVATPPKPTPTPAQGSNAGSSPSIPKTGAANGKGGVEKENADPAPKPKLATKTANSFKYTGTNNSIVRGGTSGFGQNAQFNIDGASYTLSNGQFIGDSNTGYDTTYDFDKLGIDENGSFDASSIKEGSTFKGFGILNGKKVSKGPNGKLGVQLGAKFYSLDDIMAGKLKIK